MRHLLLGLALALAVPAAAELNYTNAKELRRAGLPAQLAEAKRLKTLLELFYESADGDALKETVDVVFVWDGTVKDLALNLPYLADVKKTGRLVVPKDQVHWRFEQTADHFYSVLAAVAKIDPADKDLRSLADWGKDRSWQWDPVIEQHVKQVIPTHKYDALKLK